MLLTWLQEHESPVMLMATANDMRGLPPELLRPGRFDALFFVDLPDAAARREILSIHLDAYGLPRSPRLLSVANDMADFSGADIAASVVEAIFLAEAIGQPLTPDILRKGCQQVIPWAKTLGEELEERRHWSQGRLRPAQGEKN